MSERDNILKRLDAMPMLPPATAAVVEQFQSDSTDIAELTLAIEHDAGLTSNLLRLSNSPFFGFSREISSVREAIIRLGTSRIAQLMLASTVAPMASRPIRGYDLQPGMLWEHSLAVAIGTREIGRTMGIEPPDAVMTSAMMVDLGKIVMGTFIDVDGANIRRQAFENKISFEQAERLILGIDHAEVGSVMLSHWSIPQTIVDLVRWHHEPDRYDGDKKWVAAIHLADALATTLGIAAGSDGLNYVVNQAVVDEFGLDIRKTEEVATVIKLELDQIRPLFRDIHGGEDHGA